MLQVFFYRAKQAPGSMVEGTLEAASQDDAVRVLGQRGLTPITVSRQAAPVSLPEKTPGLAGLSRSGRVSLKKVAFFTRQMSDLLSAVVPLFRALQVVERKTNDKLLKSIITHLRVAVHDGAPLSGEMARYAGVFSLYYVSIVSAAEASGDLSKAFDHLADLLEKEEELWSQVRSSLAYPCFVLGIGFMTVFVLLSFVIPRFAVMFEEFSQALPWPTVFLMSVSGFLAHFWWLVLLGAGMLGLGLWRWGKREANRSKIDTFLLGLPGVRIFVQTLETARYTRVLGTLIESGVVLIKALDIAAATVGNRVFKAELVLVSGEVLKGISLGEALKKVSLFPETAVNMIDIGQETGHFEKGLYKIAGLFERETERIMKTGVSLLGPLMLTGVIIVVGFVVVAIMLPVLQMNQFIR